MSQYLVKKYKEDKEANTLVDQPENGLILRHILPRKESISNLLLINSFTNSFKKYLLKSVLGQVSTKAINVPNFVLGVGKSAQEKLHSDIYQC